MKKLPGTYRRDRRALGRELKALRESASISGNQLAKTLGWAQSKVSRLETGAQTPTEADLLEWSAALKLTKGERGGLLTLLHRAEAEYRTWRENYRLSGGAAGKQFDILLLEQSARAVSEFQPCIVPGLLQTAAYASELLRVPFGPGLFGATEADIDAMVATRIERQQILFDRSKQVRIIILEVALTTRVCSLQTLQEQLFRLTSLCELRSLEIGIVRSNVQLPIIPLGGYALYDTDCVVLETLSGEQQLSAAEEVAYYTQAFGALSELAGWRDAAASIIREVETRLRTGGV